MNRSAKRHRSSKVPNVKLRPAPAGTSERNKRYRQEAEAEKEDLAHYRRVKEAHRDGRTGSRTGGDGVCEDGNDDEEEEEEEEEEEDEEENDDEDRAPLLGCVICMTGIGEEKVRREEHRATGRAALSNLPTYLCVIPGQANRVHPHARWSSARQSYGGCDPSHCK
jgi:hypothetical protein